MKISLSRWHNMNNWLRDFIKTLYYQFICSYQYNTRCQVMFLINAHSLFYVRHVQRLSKLVTIRSIYNIIYFLYIVWGNMYIKWAKIKFKVDLSFVLCERKCTQIFLSSMQCYAITSRYILIILTFCTR